MYSWQMPCLTVLKHIAAFALTFCAVGIAQSPSPQRDQPKSMEALGRVGPYRIGLNYTVRHHTELVSAHYFYVTQLKDIALKGVVSGEDVELKGEDDSTFHLHFVGNGSTGKDPLTFYNSIGLSGYWTLGRQNLPVNLRSNTVPRIQGPACMCRLRTNPIRLMKRWWLVSSKRSSTETTPNWPGILSFRSGSTEHTDL